MLIAAKGSEIALNLQRNTSTEPGSTNRSLWTTALSDASFLLLGGYPISRLCYMLIAAKWSVIALKSQRSTYWVPGSTYQSAMCRSPKSRVTVRNYSSIE
jgi:hypothetical protein